MENIAIMEDSAFFSSPTLIALNAKYARMISATIRVISISSFLSPGASCI